jgi:hypothetical protein
MFWPDTAVANRGAHARFGSNRLVSLHDHNRTDKSLKEFELSNCGIPRKQANRHGFTMIKLRARLLWGFIAICAFGLSCFFTVLARLPASQTLVCNPPSHDFGSVRQNQELMTTLTLANQGSSDVHIHGAMPSCTCTVSDLSECTLAPGGRKQFRVKWNTLSRRGPISDQLAIHLTDSAKPFPRVLLVALQANVQTDLVVQPNRLSFSRYEQGSRTVRLQTLHLKDAQIEIEKATSGTSALTSRRVSPDEVEIVFDPELCPPGILKSEIVIHTSHPSEKRIVVPVTITHSTEGQ